MFENVMPGPVSGLEEDSGVRVYPYEKDHRQQPWQGLRGGFAVLSNGGSPGSQMVKGGTADLLYIYTDMEPVTFKKNALFPWRRALFSGTK